MAAESVDTKRQFVDHPAILAVLVAVTISAVAAFAFVRLNKDDSACDTALGRVRLEMASRIAPDPSDTKSWDALAPIVNKVQTDCPALVAQQFQAEEFAPWSLNNGSSSPGTTDASTTSTSTP